MIAAPTAGEAVAGAVAVLTEAGCATPRLDAELLIADSLGIDRAALVAHPARSLDDGAQRLAAERIERRVAREPVAYILGRRDFRNLELAVDRRVLIPRPQTELLVEVVATIAPQRARVHDVGTGSGAVALALKDERPDLVLSGSDSSEVALAVARENSARLGLAVELSVAPLLPEGEYDLVVANLPYVCDHVWSELAPEIVDYEPREAFLGGSDGLDAIRALVALAPSGTLLALEHAPDQAQAVGALLAESEGHHDFDEFPHVTVGRVS